MAIPSEALQKLLNEIQAKEAASAQQIGITRATMAGKAREARVLELTATELRGLPSETKIYEGVGKMFVLTGREGLQGKLEGQSKEVKEEREALEKKLHYLETTAKNSRETIERLLGGGRG